ncbi:MAG: primosomal protein N' [Pseudomonadota bacterium]
MSEAAFESALNPAGAPEAEADVPARAEAGRRVSILFPTPLPKAFDYLSPRIAETADSKAFSGEGASVGLSPGTFVEAPFAGRRLLGVVWPADGNTPAPPLNKLKEVTRVFDAPPLAPSVLDFIAWTASYTMAPLGAVLRLVMRGGDALRPPAARYGYRATASSRAGPAELKLTPAREAVLSAAAEPLSAALLLSVKELAEKAGAGEGVVRGLVKAGALEKVAIDPDPLFDSPQPDFAPPVLSQEQSAAAEGLRRHVLGEAVSGEERGASGAVLLDGVTGAGKTEVYLEAVAAVLAADPTAQILVLIPEIALTLPFLQRVEARFGAAPAPWHSDLTAAQRRRTWRRVADGSARIVVGARSALFLPFKKLRLIVVDEEHESAYKQEDGVVYQGRDLAVARGARGGFPVVLASATPSLETVVNVDQGRYDIVRLKSRFGPARLPSVGLIDLRRTPPERLSPPVEPPIEPGAENGGGEMRRPDSASEKRGAETWLSPPLVAAVDETLARNEQALLFLNRRGYAPLTICRKCGARMKSPHSDSWLVEHRFENKLVCHHTGFSMPKPKACPSCKAVDALHPCGPGVERIAEEAKKRWPTARLGILSSDTAATPQAMRVVLDAMADGAIDILVATQVVAKGHHFPGLTLVGVVDADMGLSGGDLRAGERTFQLLSQVAGRAGRSDAPGRALLQTHQPDAPVFQALVANDRDAFLAAEAAGRDALGFPPYGRLAAIILRSENEKTLREAAAAHRDALIAADGVEVMGPAPAPIYRVRGEARMRFLVKARRDVSVQRFMGAWLKRIKLPNAVRRSVDIDPYSFL